MQAIEFQATIQDGMIKIPEHYRVTAAKHAKVIVLMDEMPEQAGLLAQLLRKPLVRPDFTPLTREEVYDR